MSNYYGVGRTNYFMVTDYQCWRRFLDKYDLKEIRSQEAEDGSELLGFTCESEDRTIGFASEDMDDDWVKDLSQIIHPDYVVIYQHIGHEKTKYLNGEVFAVSSQGLIKHISIHDIYANLGDQKSKITTACEY